MREKRNKAMIDRKIRRIWRDIQTIKQQISLRWVGSAASSVGERASLIPP